MCEYVFSLFLGSIILTSPSVLRVLFGLYQQSSIYIRPYSIGKLKVLKLKPSRCDKEVILGIVISRVDVLEENESLELVEPRLFKIPL
ncbi:hypothetical protein C8R42DRAFT_677324 [Lentinula raphanica]|nr:hypothetical protein C8R42DRAFT_677324 [Lentinula raphanica]